VRLPTNKTCSTKLLVEVTLTTEELLENTKTSKWTAQIKLDGENIYIGSFVDEHTAAEAYNKKAVELFGEYARLNELPTDFTPVENPKPITSSNYRGVTWNKRKGKWVAQLQYQKKRYYNGYHDTQEEAAQAFNDMAIEVIGDKAKLNVI
jgi:hypothetical protein